MTNAEFQPRRCRRGDQLGRDGRRIGQRFLAQDMQAGGEGG